MAAESSPKVETRRGLSWLERKTVFQLWMSRTAAWLVVDGLEVGEGPGLASWRPIAVDADGVEVEDHVELVAAVVDEVAGLCERDAEWLRRRS